MGRVPQPALHYEREQVSKIDVLQKSKTFRRQGDPRNQLRLASSATETLPFLLGLFVALEVAGSFVL